MATEKLVPLNVEIRHMTPLEHMPYYSAVCCRQWDLAYGYPPGRCGICGERPVRGEVDDARRESARTVFL